MLPDELSTIGILDQPLMRTGHPYCLIEQINTFTQLH
jgi:hypothetical protein